MNVAIIGSRHFIDYEYMKQKILNIIDINDIDYIVSGEAAGADSLAEIFAEEHNLKKMVFKADWKKYGRAAGPIRNTEIVKNADVIFAFPIGKSAGTYNSIRQAEKMNKTIYVYKDLE